MSADNTVIDECLKRWNISDETAGKLRTMYESWIGQMPENMLVIVSELMKYFDYYSHQTVNKHLLELHAKLQEMDSVDFNNTIYTILPNKDGRLNSGYSYAIEYRILNNISKHVVFPNFTHVISNLEYIENIVFVDDCCGSGKTIIDFLSNYKEELKNKKIFYLVIHVMKAALDKITSFSENTGMQISILYGVCTDKAFKRCENIAEKKTEFVQESVKLGIPKADVLGFKNTEALMAFYNDTPNNTLGVFWKNGMGYTPLFPRENDDVPGWQKLKKEKEQRNRNNYMKAVGEGHG